MTGSTEKLQRELQAAQRALAEAQARCERHDAEYQAAAKEIEDNRNALLFMLEDIEAGRKKIEQAHQEWMAALDVVDDPIFLHDRNFCILRCNKAYQQCAGIPFKEVIGHPYYEIFPKADAPLPRCLRAMEKAEEEEEVVVGNAIYRSRAFSIHDEQGAYLYSVHTLEDITERKLIQENLRLSEERFSNVFHVGPAGITITRVADGKFIEVNESFLNMFERSREETIGHTSTDLNMLSPEERGRLIRRQIESGGLHNAELLARAKSGREINLLFSSQPMQVDGEDCLVTTLIDITERKQAEAALRESEERLRLALDAAHMGTFDWDVPHNRITWSRWHEELWGMKPGEFGGTYEAFSQRVHPEDLPGINAEVARCIAAREPFEREFRVVWADGSIHWIMGRGEFTFAAAGQLLRMRGAVAEISERKQAQIALSHANRALATLSAVNRNLVHVSDENELLQAICDAIVEQKGYRLAWVGYVQHDESKSIRIMARAGHDEGYLDTIQLTWADNKHGMGPSGRAIRSGATQLCQDMVNDPSYLPWRAAARQHGYAASIGLPLMEVDGTVFGILNVYAAEANAFAPNEVDLLEEMAGDLAFGVRSLHTRQERDLAMEQSRQHLEKLQNNMEDTVRAMAGLVEMRDPYTAGHQARVADLAAALAKQMGLPDEQVHGIHLAGVVHDLGKVKIPAEILSKPGKISAVEYSLIKAHPQAGYDILKDIDFPWPIAQTMLQHHERLDGTGYPQGLKGDDILLEARILSVADVVEAMSSHRPYRPGLGIDIALAEITKQRGALYDSRAVDACLALFREQGYCFK